MFGQVEDQEFDPGHVKFKISFSSPSRDVGTAFENKSPEYKREDLSENTS